jgi:hypothetical protein
MNGLNLKFLNEKEPGVVPYLPYGVTACMRARTVLPVGTVKLEPAEKGSNLVRMRMQKARAVNKKHLQM